MKIDIYSHYFPQKYWDSVIRRIRTDRLNELGLKEALGAELIRTLWTWLKGFNSD